MASSVEALAELLGEPYGTLILTISVISMEVAVLATVMLGGEPSPTLARETMFAILMIVLNGMVGMTLAIGAIRHVQQQYNLQGATAFSRSDLGTRHHRAGGSDFLPVDRGADLHAGAGRGVRAADGASLRGLLVIQTTRHRNFFVEPQGKRAQSAAEPVPHLHGELHSASYHAILLIATLLPVVLLLKPLAKLLDFGVERMGLPTALGGLIVATLILAPEGRRSASGRRPQPAAALRQSQPRLDPVHHRPHGPGGTCHQRLERVPA